MVGSGWPWAVMPRPRAQVLLGLLPFLLMAIVAAVDFLAGPSVGFLPLLSLGPALAAVSRRPAQTALVGGLALMLGLLLATYDHRLESRPGFIAFATIFGATAAGVVASAGRHRREQELADVRAVAEVAQRVVLRPVPAISIPAQAAVRYISAAASARIGGDLYEMVPTDSGMRIIVGDVQGKGLTAVQTASTVLSAFRAAAYDARGLVQIADQIELGLARHPGEEEFVTAVLAQITGGGSRIEVLNCGHPPPLLLSPATARFIEPEQPGLPLGLSHLAVFPRHVTATALGQGDRLLFYTDGISEARDRSGAFYPLGRCQALFDGQDADAALDRLSDDVTRHVGHALQDDAATLLVDIGAGPVATTAYVPGPHASQDMTSDGRGRTAAGSRLVPASPDEADDEAGQSS
ncbi:MAG TPA: PP2C family protein-serine/threonine phosphatase [Streptosporangiaceae bacterium]|jgi:serine phosphatase RsbU (regulator of sigma subunit)|nr:PP2C family protein-serine/threonine phosphatase [Streptosporangiaceae bacterium]